MPSFVREWAAFAGDIADLVTFTIMIVQLIKAKRKS